MRTDLNELKIFLKKEYKSRSQKRKSYSKRAFSRDLGLSPTVLNEFLANKREMSFKNVDKIFKYLNRNIYCSWCDKPQKEVSFLIGGPRRQFICDKCLEECNRLCPQLRSGAIAQIPKPLSYSQYPRTSYQSRQYAPSAKPSKSERSRRPKFWFFQKS